MKLGITPISIMSFFLMLGLSIVLIIDTTLFEDANNVGMYQFFLRIAPQIGYSIATFAVAVLFFLAFIMRNKFIEILGLFFTGVFLIIIFAGYLLSFPNIGTVAFGVWTLATFMTISEIIADWKEEKNKLKGGEDI